MAQGAARGDTKVYRIYGGNVTQAYEDFLWTFQAEAEKEESRNGPVMTIPYPAFLQIMRPKERVLFDPIRDANPFFHVMEFIWLMSGSKELKWINQFNSGFVKYSDDGQTLPASYGVRWRNHWGFDQIVTVINQLKRDPTSRRAVLGMWDPGIDLSARGELGADRPCNTHIYFRIVEGHLNMTVCNRSNDAIWGMLGANIVHMTYLQELVAHGIGVPMGMYYAFTNNLHVYMNLPRFEKIMASPGGHTDFYGKGGVTPYPLLLENESVDMFLEDCRKFIIDGLGNFNCQWFHEVAFPIHDVYLQKEKRNVIIPKIMATDWRLACAQWVERRQSE